MQKCKAAKLQNKRTTNFHTSIKTLSDMKTSNRNQKTSGSISRRSFVKTAASGAA
jgi:hypothetical protein